MHKLAEICIRRPVFATMLILALTVVGVFSFFNLGVDLLPNIDIPTVIITTTNPGASPEVVETEITRRIEEAVNTVSGVDELRSTSVEGLSQVVVSFILEKDVDVAAQEVRDAISRILPDLPETAEQPVIRKIDPGASPILQLVVAAPRPLRDITDIAENVISEQIQTVSGVGQVEVVGGRAREIEVRVDPNRMLAFNLTVGDVATAIQQQNLELPGGRIDAGPTEYSVRTMGRIVDSSDFNEIAIARRGDYTVRVKDIGVALDTAEEARSASLLNTQPAVTLVVSKQSGQNTVAVAEGVKRRVAEIGPRLPSGFRTEVISDQSIYINAAIQSVQTHLIEGGILASVVIFAFLANIRTTLIAAVAIPTSIISTFGFMAWQGYTLNQITLLALTLMVGIVIDDAIIVLENIFRYMEEKSYSPFDAAILGTREIGLAVMATTLSLLAVFVPVGFMGGIVGRFMASFGLTAAFAVMVSALVSFTLTPMLASRFVKPAREAESKQSWFYRRIDEAYVRMLEWTMAHRLFLVVVSLLVIASIVPLFAAIGKNFLPQDDRSEFQISITAPEGYSLAATTALAESIARDLREELPEVTDTLTSVGGAQGAVNSATIYVRLVPIRQRRRSQAELMIRARSLLDRYPANLRKSVQEAAAGAAGGSFRQADIQYFVAGPDLEVLTRLSDELVRRVRTLPDVVDVDSTLEAGRPEFRLEINRRNADDLRVRVSDIAQAVNLLIAGEEVSTFDVKDEQYDVRMRAAPEFRRSRKGLERVVVRSETGEPVTLDRVVDIVPGTGPTTIERLNRERQFTLLANVLPGGSQAAVIAEIERIVREIGLPPGYSSGVTGRSRELGRAGYYFGLAFLLSFVFMYMVLAAQFESFLHPVTILLTLPLAVPFGILSLLLFGQTVNVYSGLGLLLLFGIVKKNAILQIDHTNGLRAAGMERYEAIIQANRDRLRPILMTTISLVAGMLPLVFSSGPGSATNRSIGVLVAGGQTLCLLLTLLAVPVFYSLFDDVRELPVWRRMGRRWERWSSGVSERLSRIRARVRDSIRRPREG